MPCVLAEINPDYTIHQLRRKIREIRTEIDDLGGPVTGIPELVDSANLVRSNEYLAKVGQRQAALISAYERYSHELEVLLSSVFEIQNDLKDILKEQSSMLSPKKAGEKEGAPE